MYDRTALTDIVPPVRQEPQHNQSISSRRSRYFLATSVTKKLDHNKRNSVLFTWAASSQRNPVLFTRAADSQRNSVPLTGGCIPTELSSVPGQLHLNGTRFCSRAAASQRNSVPFSGGCIPTELGSVHPGGRFSTEPGSVPGRPSPNGTRFCSPRTAAS